MISSNTSSVDGSLASGGGLRPCILNSDISLPNWVFILSFRGLIGECMILELARPQLIPDAGMGSDREGRAQPGSGWI